MKVKFLRAARQELAEIFDHYEAQRPGLGESFRQAAWDTVELVRHSPRAFPIVDEPIRRCRLTRFPYWILYAAEDNEIVIVAVAHVRRAPRSWRGRSG
ncbi:type II toxin-antitoxin system RelE/ParE family toxin [Thiohalocapsa sp. ML1]|uniref:type II toxin-antitoxin system RelE/ParE family toxin n=1 Tax=Thiohalocapsa sp. ML1 TaxID=1431688 RepID=UPI0007320C3F|nr:type II toxin-antitoxin system RelE/ParE family toxin [Thiohalocapsa sp. ML1]